MCKHEYNYVWRPAVPLDLIGTEKPTTDYRTHNDRKRTAPRITISGARVREVSAEGRPLLCNITRAVAPQQQQQFSTHSRKHTTHLVSSACRLSKVSRKGISSHGGRRPAPFSSSAASSSTENSVAAHLLVAGRPAPPIPL